MNRQIYLSPSGNDRAPGTRNRPLKTLAAALDAAKSGDEVLLGDGIYRLERALRISGLSGLTLRADDGAQPVITSCKLLKMSEICDGDRRIWRCVLPEVVKKGTVYRTLLVNGETRNRPRLPKEGFYELVDVPDINFERAKTDPRF